MEGVIMILDKICEAYKKRECVVSIYGEVFEADDSGYIKTNITKHEWESVTNIPFVHPKDMKEADSLTFSEAIKFADQGYRVRLPYPSDPIIMTQGKLRYENGNKLLLDQDDLEGDWILIDHMTKGNESEQMAKYGKWKNEQLAKYGKWKK